MRPAGVRVLVAADDRTGALETAGAVADAIDVTVPVLAGLDQLAGLGAPVVVVDLGSRHLDPRTAAQRAARAARVDAAERHAHKIDSTLRGNWPSELAARTAVGGTAVLVVPALPALGRTCRDGIVRDGDVPVHLGPSAHDVGQRVSSSRPAELLASAGVVELTEVAPGGTLEAWLRSPVGAAVCDAVTDDDLERIADAWVGGRPTVLAGTSAAIAAAVRGLVGARGGGRPARPVVAAPVLVVCGSFHRAAREQIAAASQRGAVVTEELDAGAVDALTAGRPVVLVSPVPTGAPDPDTAARVAASLAAAAHRAAPRTLVVIGGDTAAAVLGDGRLDVGGTLAPGTPWARRPGDPTLLVTRSGGFGGPDALVELLSTTLSS